MKDHIIVLDSENRIAYANLASKQLSSPPGIDLVGSRIDQILSHHAELVNLFTDLRPMQTVILITVANVPRYFYLSLSPLHDRAKSAIFWLVVLHDITLEKNVEEELRQAKATLELTVAKCTAALEDANQKINEELALRSQVEQRYRELFQEAPVMYVITREQQGKAIIFDCNQLFLDTLGYQLEDVRACPLADFYTPASRALLAQNYLPAMKEGIQMHELQLVTSQGRIIETLLQAMPEFDPEGTTIGTRATFLNVTVHKQTERKFQRLLEAAPDATVIVNEAGFIVLANNQTEAMFGYSRDDLLSQPLHILIPERFHQRHLKHLADYSLMPQARPMGAGLELSARHRDGSEFHVEISLSTLETEDELLITSTIRDVSERKRTEEALKLQRKQLRRLAKQLREAQEFERKELALELHDRVGQRLAALDFNLNLINNILTQDPSADDQIRTLIDRSLDLLAQTGERVRNLMDDLRPPALDLGLLAALDWYATKFMASTGTAITVAGREPAPRLDPMLELVLFRIAQEAFSNILKHARATNVTVHLETDPEQDIVRLAVTDDGVGFEPSSRAGPADRQSWGLIGMKERAEAVGAHCRIESIPGQGTQVIVELSR